jgi:hypothetical protein
MAEPWYAIAYCAVCAQPDDWDEIPCASCGVEMKEPVWLPADPPEVLDHWGVEGAHNIAETFVEHQVQDALYTLADGLDDTGRLIGPLIHALSADAHPDTIAELWEQLEVGLAAALDRCRAARVT